MKKLKKFKTPKKSVEKRERKGKKSIKKNLLLGLVSLSTVISILCGLTSGFILYRNTYNSMQDEVSLAAKAYSQLVQKQVSLYQNSIEVIAQNETITSDTASTYMIQAAKSLLAAQYGFQEIHTTDAKGMSDNSVDVSQTDFFKNAIRGKTVVSSPFFQKDSSTGDMVMAVAAKKNTMSASDGIVYALIRAESFNSVIEAATVGKNGSSAIFDKTGTVIAAKDASLVKNQTNYIENAKKDTSYTQLADAVKRAIAGKTGSQQYSAQGKTLFMAYIPIQNADGWAIGVNADVSEMMSNFYSALIITVVLTAVFIAVSCILAFRIANPIAKPIVSLVGRIGTLAEGDLRSPVPEIKSNHEVGTLASSFTDTVNALNGYVGEISSVLGSLANGDFTVKPVQNYKGDFIEIKDSLNKIIDNLNETFESIKQSTDQVASGAAQVSDAAQALSQGATMQASSIEELSASITEIAAEVNKNATNAAHANQLSQEASSEVLRGNEHMGEMTSAMIEISTASGEIGKIIKTIEDIAFQTNILALNAAVEAARAGSAGKGFAVVADEVRNLASKSAEAAKNTTSLIENSVRAVQHGTKIATQTADSLDKIIHGVKETTNLVGEIAQASNHQATAINQVMTGVDQISAVVQTNSATSEETAATSEELNSQMLALRDTLSGLTLKSSASLLKSETDFSEASVSGLSTDELQGTADEKY